MARSSDTLLGALDLLILKTLARGPNHGFGIALHIQTVSEGLLRVEEGSLLPRAPSPGARQVRQGFLDTD
jgi:DNA-binding PadR family transcriptional regulator